jgi:hypothetical protein
LISYKCEGRIKKDSNKDADKVIITTKGIVKRNLPKIPVTNNKGAKETIVVITEAKTGIL